ncbi:tetratricopeptide repeat-containing sensor histidine kinase [Marinoscillum pacificum]|uniref:tetratricopeptide repeat-containing sensor histidine kinase n=1 Tax=Marinoscillum pacificum TaxID=392723 RepID=UPI002157BD6B|nr:tetratricopeptide repeat-containing sensor histidine kinase [Marinoscillum pacificum]
MRCNFCVIIFLLVFLRGYSQDQRIADSLLFIYDKQANGDLNASEYSELVWSIAFNSTNPQEKIRYSNEMIDFSLKNGDEIGVLRGYYQLGDALRKLGNLDSALQVFFKCLEISKRQEAVVSNSVGESLVAIADIYSILGSHQNAIDYYKQAIFALTGRNKLTLASVQLNLGDEYFNYGELDSALFYFEASQLIYQDLDYTIGVAYSLGNIGLVYAKQGHFISAEKNIQLAVNSLDKMEDYYGISIYLTYMADIYEQKHEINSALKYASKSMQLAIRYGLKEQIRDASLKLSQLFEMQRNIDSAYYYHKQYVAFRDSINNEETIQKIADIRTEYEVGQKQAEVDVLTAQQKTERVIMAAITLLAVVLLILGLIVYKYYKQKSRTSQELERLNQTKDKFFSIISHDLRGPVSSFMGISRMIKFLVEAKETDQLLEIADDIDDSVERLSALLDNLLNWAMQQQGHFPNVPEKVSLNDMADEIVKTLKNMAQGKLIDLKADISESIDLWVDRNTTMTILRNLVSNALKFTPETGAVMIQAYSKHDRAIIKIKDTGVGISQDKLENLFKLQDKKSTYGTAGEKGLGLGLQLVYEFIEMNQGRIDVSSEEGKGTTFEISLPLFSYSEQLVES